MAPPRHLRQYNDDVVNLVMMPVFFRFPPDTLVLSPFPMTVLFPTFFVCLMVWVNDAPKIIFVRAERVVDIFARAKDKN